MGCFFFERNDVGLGPFEELHEARLLGAVPEYLSNNTRRYVDHGLRLGENPLEQSFHALVFAFHRDQRTGIESDAWHVSPLRWQRREPHWPMHTPPSSALRPRQASPLQVW